MNYLQLCRRVARECGISGTGPAAVAGQSGEALRIVNWTASAWDDLQQHRPNWYWMRDSFSFQTVANDGSYSSADAGIATRFSAWDVDSIRLYETSVNDERELVFSPYKDFRSQYLVGSQTASRPDRFSIAPSLNLLLGPKPNGVYTVSGEYIKSAQTLSADADEPELPSQYHMAIVYRAMMMYARYESAAEIYDDAERNYKRILRKIELNQLPDADPIDPML